MRVLNLFCGLIILTVFFAPEANALIGLDFRYNFLKIDTDIKANSAGTRGTKIDLQDDLGCDNTKHLPEFDLYIMGKNHSLNLSYSWFEIKGSRTLTRPLLFNGRTFNLSTRVSTDIDAHWAKLFYGYNFSRSRTSLTTTLIGVEYFDVRASLESDQGFSTSEHMRIPIPAAGLKVHKLLYRGLEFRGFVAGFKWDLGDVDVMLIDAYAGLAYNFNRSTCIFGGYRYFLGEFETGGSDNLFDTRFQGPCVGITLRY